MTRRPARSRSEDRSPSRATSGRAGRTGRSGRGAREAVVRRASRTGAEGAVGSGTRAVAARTGGGRRRPDGPPFPDRLRDARTGAGLSQAELAARAGLQPSAVSHYEGGSRRPSLRNLQRLANALDVTIDSLVGRSGAPGAVAEDAGDPLVSDLLRLGPADREVVRALVTSLLKRRRTGA